jgi:hypothetical protein
MPTRPDPARLGGAMLHLDARPAPVRPARHGQGPVWDDRAGELLWVDRAGETRRGRGDPAGGVHDLAVRQAGEPAEGLSREERAAQPHAGRLVPTRAPDVIGRPASRNRRRLRGRTRPVSR